MSMENELKNELLHMTEAFAKADEVTRRLVDSDKAKSVHLYYKAKLFAASITCPGLRSIMEAGILNFRINATKVAIESPDCDCPKCKPTCPHGLNRPDCALCSPGQGMN